MPLQAKGSGGARGTLRLTVLLPVYSETTSVIETVAALHEGLAPEQLQEILIIIAPRSTAESFAVCEELVRTDPKVRLMVQKKVPGLGWALREGFEAARGTHVVIMGSDGETDPRAVPRMIEVLQATGCDIVTANRWTSGGGFQGYNPVKLVLNFLFQNLMRVLFRTHLADMTYGFRLMPTPMVQAIKWEYTRHELLLETIARPLRLGARVEQVPVRWTTRSEGESKNTFWQNFAYFRVALHVVTQSPASMVRAGRDPFASPEESACA